MRLREHDSLIERVDAEREEKGTRVQYLEPPTKGNSTLHRSRYIRVLSFSQCSTRSSLPLAPYSGPMRILCFLGQAALICGPQPTELIPPISSSHEPMFSLCQIDDTWSIFIDPLLKLRNHFTYYC